MKLKSKNRIITEGQLAEWVSDLRFIPVPHPGNCGILTHFVTFIISDFLAITGE